MRVIFSLLSSLIIGFWIVAIALISIQNVYLPNDSLLTLRFLTFESIELPVGIVLACSAAGGFIAGGLLPVFFLRRKKRRVVLREEDFDPLENWDEFEE
ncbi:MAG: lipopolysaccharide assembly protein LapA domain-containing protein [Halothece sp.]